MSEQLGYDGIEFDKPHDECGVVVVVSPDYDAGHLAALGISQLANRGHEMTGIVIDNGDTMPVTTSFGTGEELFPDGGYSFSFTNPSRRALAHARYSTQGTQDLLGAQPHEVSFFAHGIRHSLAHIENGNLTNTHELAGYQGMNEHDYITDNHLMLLTFRNNMLSIIDEEPDQPLDVKELVMRTLPMFEGAFTSALMIDDKVVVYNDHHGLKPGMIGELPNGGIMIASEVTALEAAGADFRREMSPGEAIIIQNDGSHEAFQWAEPEPKRCVLEILYVMKPETARGTLTSFGGVAIKDARRNAGRAVAQHDETQADFGFGIPNSGIPVGEGYCEAAGLDYNETALIANKTRRSFIEPTQEKREAVVAKKLEPNSAELQGKKVVGAEDSLIRGTTTKKINAMLREAGAQEVHLRVGAPLIIDTCDLGIDLGTTDQLLAAKAAEKLGISLQDGYDALTKEQITSMIEEMRGYIGVDSLAFITPEQLRTQVLGEKAGEFCMKCMTGEKPNPLPTLVDIRTSAKKLVTSVV